MYWYLDYKSHPLFCFLISTFPWTWSLFSWSLKVFKLILNVKISDLVLSTHSWVSCSENYEKCLLMTSITFFHWNLTIQFFCCFFFFFFWCQPKDFTNLGEKDTKFYLSGTIPINNTIFFMKEGDCSGDFFIILSEVPSSKTSPSKTLWWNFPQLFVIKMISFKIKQKKLKKAKFFQYFVYLSILYFSFSVGLPVNNINKTIKHINSSFCFGNS